MRRGSRNLRYAFFGLPIAPTKPKMTLALLSQRCAGSLFARRSVVTAALVQNSLRHIDHIESIVLWREVLGGMNHRVIVLILRQTE